MPVLESTDHIAPRSVLRHRPINGDSPNIGKRSIPTTASTPMVQRASRPQPSTQHSAPDMEEELEVDEWEREDELTRASLHIPARRTATGTTSKTLPHTPMPHGLAKKQRLSFRGIRNAHPLLYLGVGMLGMLMLWTILMSFFSWYTNTMDDIHYGRPRTYQTDAYVGHSESPGAPSHFIALNLHSHIEVIEFPGGDASHARIFMGPQLFTANSDLVVVTLRFIDVNGDHKPDMVVNFQGTQVVFINDAGTFRPLRPEERPAVEQFLQQHP